MVSIQGFPHARFKENCVVTHICSSGTEKQVRSFGEGGAKKPLDFFDMPLAKNIWAGRLGFSRNAFIELKCLLICAFIEEMLVGSGSGSDSGNDSDSCSKR
ncbi:hypothetical protein L1887_35736 [Cichorium endivia]|nr:hypothetical protein L1887_35736 [Cichorium endivia]